MLTIINVQQCRNSFAGQYAVLQCYSFALIGIILVDPDNFVCEFNIIDQHRATLLIYLFFVSPPLLKHVDINYYDRVKVAILAGIDRLN